MDNLNAKLLLNQPFKEPYKYGNQELLLTFDEFLTQSANIDVLKFSRGKDPEPSDIVTAAKSMRKPDQGLCFGFSLENLDDYFPIPKEIQNIDLYTRYWPAKHLSSPLKKRAVNFYGYHSNYTSSQHRAQSGLNEWLYVIEGKLRITVIKPTKLNSLSQSFMEDQDDDDEANPTNPCTAASIQSGTVYMYNLKKGDLIYIPTGWITRKRATRVSFAIGGEFLHINAIRAQLENLKSITGKQWDVKLETQIRSIYWILAARLLDKQTPENRHILALMGSQTRHFYKETLKLWKILGDSGEVPEGMYSPAGFNLTSIIRDFEKLVKTSRKPFDTSSDSINITSR